MKTITQILTEIVSDAFEKCGYDRSFGTVFVSDRMDLCQFQCFLIRFDKITKIVTKK